MFSFSSCCEFVLSVISCPCRWTSYTPSYVSVRGWPFFFFSSRRRHTRFDCDWSSDVCSSDLDLSAKLGHHLRSRRQGSEHRPTDVRVPLPRRGLLHRLAILDDCDRRPSRIALADRKSVV